MVAVAAPDPSRPRLNPAELWAVQDPVRNGIQPAEKIVEHRSDGAQLRAFVQSTCTVNAASKGEDIAGDSPDDL